MILKWDAVPVLDAGGLDAFQRFVKRLPEGCELRVCNVEFQPLRTMARAGIQPIPGRLAFFPNRRAAMAVYKYEIDQSAQTDWSANCIIC